MSWKDAAIVQLVGWANLVPEVVGLIPAHNTFSLEKQITEIIRYYTISHRKSKGKWR